MTDTIVTVLQQPEEIVTQLQVGQGPAGVGANPGIFTATENLTAGMMVNITSSGVQKADKGHYTKEAHGFVILPATNGEPVTVYFMGHTDVLSGLTVGPYYLDTNGGITSTPPSLGPGMCQLVGYASTATRFHFLPSIPVVLAGTPA
jgi:hypothetical protein